MRNIHDWCISRQLWWGHQIPAWYCTECSPRLEATGAHRLLARRAARGRAPRRTSAPSARARSSSRTRTCSTPGSPRGCGRSRRSAGPSRPTELQDLLPHLRHGDRPRHPLLLGRPDDDVRPALHEGRALPHRLPARHGARREGREDVQGEGERDRSPRRHPRRAGRAAPPEHAQQVPPGHAARSARTRCASRSPRSPSRAATSSSRWTAWPATRPSPTSCGTPAASR